MTRLSHATIFYTSATAVRTSCRLRHQQAAKTNNSIVSRQGNRRQVVRQIDRPYDVREDARHAQRRADDKRGSPNSLCISECMLNKQRRVKPQTRRPSRMVSRRQERFGVDEDVCTGDHACIRLSGCPSLSVKQLDDPLRDDRSLPSTILCRLRKLRRGRGGGILCPSFYRATSFTIRPDGTDGNLGSLWPSSLYAAAPGSPASVF